MKARTIVLVGWFLLVAFALGVLFTLPGKPIWQAVITPTPIPTATLAPTVTPIPTATLAPTVTPVLVYPAPNSPIPNILKITSIFDFSMGTGYFAWEDGEVVVYSVAHVAHGYDLLLQSDLINQLDQFEYDCVIVGTAGGYEDGVCLIHQDIVTETNIVRDVSEIPNEVSIFNKDLEVWMPFEVINTEPYGFVAKGLPFDTNSDNKIDYVSFVCEGLSGSPGVQSVNGVPTLDPEGNMISRGEVAFTFFDDIGDECTTEIHFLNLKMK